MDAKHKGYEIEHREESNSGDHWFCRELGLASSQLGELRKAIDEADRAGRRLDLPALQMKSDWRGEKPELRECTISLRIDDKECWIRTKAGGREKEYAYNLFPPTDETRKLYAEWREAVKEAARARSHAEKLRKAIPTIKLKAVADADPV